ncbi:hypothetical protein AGDE_04235 [Angomonas deanei]|nr:hypothetical protein AGDE_04235 [Angomonas deanei]|eukprot:EPY39693.1 hypothetical protein AGDE_04235 [Angomonas deanei]
MMKRYHLYWYKNEIFFVKKKGRKHSYRNTLKHFNGVKVDKHARKTDIRLVSLLLFVELTLLLDGGVLVLLVLGDEVVHVGLGLGELHLVHTLTGVPVKEGLAAEHTSELLTDTAEHLLDAGVVTDEGDGHLETLGGNIADGGLYVVGDPLDEVGRVLVLDVEHLLIDLLGGHATAEERGGGEVAAVAGVGGLHHVLGVEHLLGELGHGETAVLLGAAAGEGGEAHHEEVQTGEGHEVDGELAEVRVELTGEAEAAGDTGHDSRDEMVEVAEGGSGELEGSETDIVQSLIVDAHRFIGVLDQLVDGEGGVVGLDDGIGHLGGGDDGEGHHDTVGVLLAELGDEQGTHTGTRTATHGVGQLEALEAVAALGLLAADVEDGVDELGTFGVVALGPVVTGTGLSKDEVVGAEELAIGTGADGVHRAGLEVDQDRAGHVAAASGLVKVHVDALQLKIGVTLVGTSGINAMLVRNYLPELGTNLVTALAGLARNDLTHCD